MIPVLRIILLLVYAISVVALDMNTDKSHGIPIRIGKLIIGHKYCNFVIFNWPRTSSPSANVLFM
jgi:hypothetical protein